MAVGPVCGPQLNALRLAVGWTILLAWAASFLMSAVDRTFHPDPSLQVLATIVAGALFAPSILNRIRKNGNSS